MAGPDRGLDERRTVFDRVEDRLDDRREQGDSIRPLRDAVEKLTNQLPEGPYGKAGKGNIAAIVGYFAVKTGQLVTLPIPGVRQPGFHAISHGVETFEDYERHTVRVNAAYEDVARVASEYDVAAPSNIDYITSEVESVEVNLLKERPTYSTYEFVIDIADRGSKNQ